MKLFALSAAALIAATGAFAGDAGAGEGDFRKCKSCHTLANGDDVIIKGGKTGPNLFGVIGRQAGTVEGFKYGADLVAAGEAGLIWDEELLATYMADPKKFLSEQLGSAAKSKMTFKMKGGEDVAAYLASLSAE
ncbi:cytochrome C [Celeribacter arenosi]|uniref:Cytochrome c2 n=1 Tax=Celeribacter arenosi TaxID=792649 RepID=A0ABP7JVD2_9RHOB